MKKMQRYRYDESHLLLMPVLFTDAEIAELGGLLQAIVTIRAKCAEEPTCVRLRDSEVSRLEFYIGFNPTAKEREDLGPGVATLGGWMSSSPPWSAADEVNYVRLEKHSCNFAQLAYLYYLNGDLRLAYETINIAIKWFPSPEILYLRAVFYHLDDSVHIRRVKSALQGALSSSHHIGALHLKAKILSDDPNSVGLATHMAIVNAQAAHVHADKFNLDPSTVSKLHDDLYFFETKIRFHEGKTEDAITRLTSKLEENPQDIKRLLFRAQAYQQRPQKLITANLRWTMYDIATVIKLRPEAIEPQLIFWETLAKYCKIRCDIAVIQESVSRQPQRYKSTFDANEIIRRGIEIVGGYLEEICSQFLTLQQTPPEVCRNRAIVMLYTKKPLLAAALMHELASQELHDRAIRAKIDSELRRQSSRPTSTARSIVTNIRTEVDKLQGQKEGRPDAILLLNYGLSREDIHIKERASLLRRKGRILSLCEQFEESLAVFSEFLTTTRSPNLLANGYCMMAYAHRKLMQFTEAHDCLQQARELQPTNSGVLDGIRKETEELGKAESQHGPRRSPTQDSDTWGSANDSVAQTMY